MMQDSRISHFSQGGTGVSEEEQFFDNLVLNPDLNKLIGLLFPPKEIDMYLDKVGNQSIRSLAMKYHMSRYNVRKNLHKISQKIEGMKKLLINL